MPSLNKVMLMGNLTRDPELRYTPKGQAVTDITIASNRKYKTAEGELRDEVTFVDITFWGKQAEVICQWMKKGRPLYVEGRIQMDTWDDKQTGKKMSRLKVVGDDFQFLGGKDSGSGGSGAGGGGNSSEGGEYEEPRSSRPPQRSSGPSQPARQESNAFPPGLDEEDEIPF